MSFSLPASTTSFFPSGSLVFCLPAHPTSPLQSSEIQNNTCLSSDCPPWLLSVKKKKERKKNPCHPSFMTAWIPDKLRFIMCIQWRPPGYVPWMSITNHRGEESKQAVSFFYLENIIFIIIEEYNKQNQINTLHGQNSSWGQKSLRGQHGSPWEAWVLCPLCPVWVDPGDSRVTQGPPGSLHLLTLDLLLSFPLFPTKAKKQKVKELGHLFGIEKDGWVEGKLSFFLVS